MFTMRQIALGGFLGVYSGCLPLTVNLARIPYRRGAVIGVFFSALTHLMTTLLYILTALTVGSIMHDEILRQPSSWIVIAIAILVIQALTSAGCQIMGAYFHSPKKKSDPFDRDKLYERLKPLDLRDNPEDGSRRKRSVLHDVVLSLERYPALPDVRYSSAWIVLFGILSLVSTLFWIQTLNIATLQMIFLPSEVDTAWYFIQSLRILVPLALLVLAHFSVLAWLCRDMPNNATQKENS